MYSIITVLARGLCSSGLYLDIMSPNRILDQFSNQYGSFSVEELIYDTRPARVLFSGPLHSAQSGLALDGKPRLLFDYNQLLFELVLELNPKSILLLGGGTLTLPTALIKELPNTHITTVEMNKDLITTAEKFFDYIPDNKLEIIIDDAEHFIMKAKPLSYDLIITDLFDSLAIPQKFQTANFAHHLKRVSKSKGVVVTNCIAAVSGNGAMPMLKLYAAYLSALGSVRVFKVDQHRYMNWTPQNLLLLAGGNTRAMLKGVTEISVN